MFVISHILLFQLGSCSGSGRRKRETGMEKEDDYGGDGIVSMTEAGYK